ncbi:MAG: HEPN domain-containing protein [Pseudomonadota bacterium]|nr:HEPN domain-containing protein [Pseudomonadota bacterium]
MTTSLDEARRFLSLAADDLAAFRALAALPHIRPAIAFFHAQQAIEKSLKAVLFARGEEFRKTHDLYELADRLAKAGFTLPCDADELAQINPYAVEFRYGDEIIQIMSREEMDAITMRMLSWAETTVGRLQP